MDASGGVGGLASRYDEHHWFAIEADGRQGGTRVTARASVAGLGQTWQATLPAGEVTLAMETARPSAGFSAEAMGGDRVRLVAEGGGDAVTLTELDGRYWTAETAASFTGRVVGLYATEGTVAFAGYRYRGDDGPSRLGS